MSMFPMGACFFCIRRTVLAYVEARGWENEVDFQSVCEFCCKNDYRHCTHFFSKSVFSDGRGEPEGGD